MMESENKISRLIEEITLAFEDVEYPGDNNIVSHDCIECERVKNAFSGKHWKDVTLEFITPMYRESTCLFTPKAFCFYLPAYLIISVKHFYEADVTNGSIVFDLTPPHLRNIPEPYDDIDIEHFLERMEALNLKQRKAVLSFLEFMRKEHGEDLPAYGLDAVIEYWKEIIEKSKPSK